MTVQDLTAGIRIEIVPARTKPIYVRICIVPTFVLDIQHVFTIAEVKEIIHRKLGTHG